MEKFLNNGRSSLTSAITNVATSFAVADGSSFLPNEAGTFRVLIDSEILVVSSVSGSTFTISERGAEGTTAVGHSANASVVAVVTKGGILQAIADGIATIEPVTANRALISDGTGDITVSPTTATELGYVSGVTSAIQDQLDDKAAATHTHVIGDTTDLQSALDDKADSSSLATVATSGDYGDLSNTPTIPTVDVTTDILIGDNTGNAVESGFSFPLDPTDPSAMLNPLTLGNQMTGSGGDHLLYVNASGFLSEGGNFDGSTLTVNALSSDGNNFYTDGSGNVTATSFTGDGSTLTGLPTIDATTEILIGDNGGNAVASGVAVGDLATLPIDAADTTGFATVATSGSFNDLADVPTIPELPIDAADVTGLGAVAYDNDYGSLDNLPDIPTFDQDLNTTDNVTFGEVHARLFPVTDITLGTCVIYDGASSQGNEGQVLTSHGASTPTWEDPPVPSSLEDLEITGTLTFGTSSEILDAGSLTGNSGDILTSGGAGNGVYWQPPENPPVYLQQIVVEPSTDCTTANGVGYFHIVGNAVGKTATFAYAQVITAGATGVMEIGFRRRRGGSTVNMLTTTLRVGDGEYSSEENDTDVNFNESNSGLQLDDLVIVDILGELGTPAQGLLVTLVCEAV